MFGTSFHHVFQASELRVSGDLVVGSSLFEFNHRNLFSDQIFKILINHNIFFLENQEI